ncbi:MAG TPA: DUF4367 domain-containing protein [Candidatus Saccharimonas sp.]|nr:DUF4367 domain-containing protein [Candidatus Saccharimonas sp.]
MFAPHRALDLRLSRSAHGGGAGAAALPQAPATAVHASRTAPSGRFMDLRAPKSSGPAGAAATSLATARSSAAAESSPSHVTATKSAPTNPAAAPHSTVHEQRLNRFEDRFSHAKGMPRSGQISRFGQPIREQFGQQVGQRPGDRFEDRFSQHYAPGKQATFDPAHPHGSPLDHHLGQELPAQTAAQHTAMAGLAHATHVPGAAAAGPRAVSFPSAPRLSQATALVAIVVVIGAYIWLQNYPKLAATNAGRAAGISASLPGYLPSSYSLATTDTKPGLVTFHFASPSDTDQLTITQQRTTWDAVSLLDNFVTSQATDYSAIEGQGLTIYLYGTNRAAWVNHGIQYQITGAGRLSRDQILKIAYSL